MVGIASPSLAKIEQRWEYKDQEQLVAKIQIDKQGNARYFIDAPRHIRQLIPNNSPAPVQRPGLFVACGSLNSKTPARAGV